MLSPVLLLHNLPSEEAQFTENCGASDAGVMRAVQHVAGALAALQVPHRVAGVRRLAEIPAALAGGEPVVFNLVERLDGGVNDCNYVPAVCRAFGRACTGGTTDSLVLTLDKDLTKARLAAHGVRYRCGELVGRIPCATEDLLAEVQDLDLARALLEERRLLSSPARPARSAAPEAGCPPPAPGP